MSNYFAKDIPTKAVKEDTVKTNRTYAALEIYNTEIKYVQDLRLIKRFYIDALKEKHNSILVTKQEVNNIFSGVEVILKLGSQFCIALGEKCINWTDDLTIGDIFIKFAPFFKMYTHYTCRYQDASRTLLDLQKVNLMFRNFIEKQDRKATHLVSKRNGSQKIIKLVSLMIAPVQRVPRYKLLLIALLNNTSMDHPDYGLLVTAIKKMNDATLHIEKFIAQIEDQHKLILLQDIALDASGAYPINLLRPGVSYVYDGWLRVQFFGGNMSSPSYRRSKNSKYIGVLLKATLTFSLILARKSSLGVEQKDITISQWEDRENEIEISTNSRDRFTVKENEHQILIHGYPWTVLLRFDTIQEKTKWVKVLESSMPGFRKSVIDRVESKQSILSTYVAIWKDDKTACMHCGKKYGFFIRCHHCRKCGYSVCHGCSKHTAMIPVIDTINPVRVCNKCYASLRQTEEFEKELPLDRLRRISLRLSENRLVTSKNEVNDSKGKDSKELQSSRPFVNNVLNCEYSPMGCTIGAHCYTDSSVIITKLSSALNGLPIIRTANKARGSTSAHLLTLDFCSSWPGGYYLIAIPESKRNPFWIQALCEETNYFIEICQKSKALSIPFGITKMSVWRSKETFVASGPKAFLPGASIDESVHFICNYFLILQPDRQAVNVSRGSKLLKSLLNDNIDNDNNDNSKHMISKTLARQFVHGQVRRLRRS